LNDLTAMLNQNYIVTVANTSQIDRTARDTDK